MATDKIHVLDFIREYKHIATTSSRGLDVIPRKDNRDGLLDLGITARIREDLILGLTLEDYCKGPDPDRDRPGFIWEFGITLNEVEVYIKLKIAEVDGVKIAKCLSFHRAKHAQSYPYRTGGRK